jgi:MoxR-like ATPase
MGVEKEDFIGAGMERESIESKILEISRLYTAINQNVEEFVVGNRHLIDSILIALFSEGHILIEGVPGTAKTTIAKSIAIMTGCAFNRIQGAIDLQPADMIGVRIYDQQQKEFILRKGPIFTNILLADEINRVNPKSQSAFIEAMSERQATIDGITMPLPIPFFVIATQNPFEFEGTFPLIEAQRDRFMLSIKSSYLSSDDELNIIRRVHSNQLDWDSYSRTIKPILSPETIRQYVEVVGTITVEEPVLAYIRDLVIATRTHPDIELGASSRASIALVRGGKGMAAIRNRTFVIPDDIKQIAHAVLGHRILLTRGAEVEGLTVSQVVDEILTKVEVL